MNSQKTICLCLIVKNEEKTLPRLIESCRKIIDYWVIYDTGSTDNTITVINKKLKGIPGELYEEPFKDFGYNRTLLVEKARGKADYLLLMDADMTVHTQPGFDKNRLDADSFMIRYMGALDFAQPLLVSGAIKWYYQGYTHEYITTDEQYTQGTCRLMVNHKADGGSRADKYTRDVDLCQEEIRNFPRRSRPYFYLGMSLQNLKRHEEAIEAYKERISRGGWGEEIYYSLYQIGISLYNLGDKESAVLQFMEAYDARPTRFESLFMLGQISRENKKYSAAKLFFDKLDKMPYPKNDLLFIHRPQKEYLVNFELGICNYWLGNYREAERHCRKVMENKNADKSIKEQNKKNFEFVRRKLQLKKDKKNDIVYASMYTHGTPYEDEVKTLKVSLNKYSLFNEIMGIRPQGSWVRNTQQKPIAILDIMNRNNKDVVWIDADAEVLDYPYLFDKIDCDIAYHTIEQWDEMLTGTIYFKNNDKVKSFLRQWIKLNNSNNLPDAKNFQQLMKEDKELKKESLPAAYVRIFDNPHMKGIIPVIQHNQASRRFKEAVDTGISPDNLIFSLFDNIINDRESCSVIGNGPSKTDLSDKIEDSFVIRCNNFKTGDDYPLIGSRTDICVNSMYHEVVPQKKVEYPIFAVLPLSGTMYQHLTDAKEMHLHWEKNAYDCINAGNNVWTYTEKDDFAKVFGEVSEAIQAFPTVGILAIAMARALKFKTIILSGFTFFSSDKSHYWKDEKVIPSSHHNPEEELKLLSFWIDTDEDVKYILDENLKETFSIHETAQ